MKYICWLKGLIHAFQHIQPYHDAVRRDDAPGYWRCRRCGKLL
jgi:hypothetical protein